MCVCLGEVFFVWCVSVSLCVCVCGGVMRFFPPQVLYVKIVKMCNTWSTIVFRRHVLKSHPCTL